MNFKYYFPALVLTGIFVFSSCEHHSDSSDPSDPENVSTRHISRPDSVYFYRASQDTVGTPAYIDYYQYDANGNMLSCLSCQGLSRQYASKEERSYDARNNLLEIRYYSFDEMRNEWYCQRTDKQTYDSQGKPATLETAHGDNGLKKKAVYSWSDDTHAVADVYAYRSKTDSTGWFLEDKAEYTYTADGQVKYENYIWEYYSGSYSNWEYFFEYDKYGNRVSEKFINSDKLQEYRTYKYSYDPDGNILVKWTYSNISGNPVLQTKELYFYLHMSKKSSTFAGAKVFEL